MAETVTDLERARARTIIERLHATYPDAHCSLDFTSPLELTVATILSAQCTDERVNIVTKTLFTRYQTVADYANAPLDQLEADIKSTGFYHNKAKSIQGMARMVIERFGGELPSTMAELVQLPGVARKTANVVQGNAFHTVEGIAVDTHVGRLSRRLGLTTSDDPVKVEREMMLLVDRAHWLDFSHLLIYHGRAVCKAPSPRCTECLLLDLCPTGKALTGTQSVS